MVTSRILSSAMLVLALFASAIGLPAELRAEDCVPYRSSKRKIVYRLPNLTTRQNTPEDWGYQYQHLSTDQTRYFFKVGSLFTVINLKTGAEQLLDLGANANSYVSGFSPDEKKVSILVYRKGSDAESKGQPVLDHTIIWDTETNRSLKISAPPPDQGSDSELLFSSDSKRARVGKSDGSVQEYDLATGTASPVRRLKRPQNQPKGTYTLSKIDKGGDLALSTFLTSEATAQASTKSYSEIMSNARFSLVDLNTMRSTPIDFKGDPKRGYFQPVLTNDHKSLVTVVGNEIEVIDLSSGTKHSYSSDKVKAPYVSEQSPTGRYLVFIGDGNRQILDLEKRTWVNAPDAQNQFSSMAFGKDGKSIVVSTDNELRTIDLETGNRLKTIPVQGCSNNFQISPNSKKAGYQVAYYDSQGKLVESYVLIDLETGERAETDLATTTPVIGDDGTIIDYPDRTVRITTDIESFCAPQGRKIDYTTPPAATCQPTSAAPIPPTAAETLKALHFEELCKTDYSPADWQPVRASIPETGPIPRDSAIALLKEIQKPGGFIPKKDVEILFAIFRSDIPKTEPDLVNQALAGIMEGHPSIYRDLLTRFPYLSHLPSPGKTPACRSDAEAASNLQASSNFVLSLANQNLSAYSQWESNLAPLRQNLANLSPAVKAELREKIALSLADNVPLRQGELNAKHYCFESTARLFGEKPKLVSELVIPPFDSRSAVILSTQPIDGDKRTLTSYGYYARRYPELQFPEPTTQAPYPRTQISWESAGKIYHGDLEVHPADSSKIAPRTAAPNYEQFWSGNSLTGLVLVSSGSHPTTDEYLAYYQQEGFTFAENPETQSPSEFFNTKMTNGELRYLANTSANQFLGNTLRIRVGEKHYPDGRSEKVYIATWDSSDGWYYGRREIAQLISERNKKNDAPPVAYFDFGAENVSNGPSLIRTVAQPKFLYLPNLSGGSFDPNQLTENVLFKLLSGFRQKKTYAEMRTALSTGPLATTYHFPDQQSYHDKLLSGLFPEVHMKVEDERGNRIGGEQ